jgi:hypothetical protein
LSGLQKGNAKTSEGQKGSKDADAAAEAAMDARREASDAEIKLLREAGEKTVIQLNQTEREKIDATKSGSAARLQAIVSAISNEESWGLKDSSFYRQLLVERVNTTREVSEEEARITAEAGQEQARHTEKMGELAVQAQKTADALQMSTRRTSEQERTRTAVAAANAEYAVKFHALTDEAAAVDRAGKDAAIKLKQIQDKETELVRSHENEIAAIKAKAEEDSSKRVIAAESHMADAVASGLTKSIMGHQSWAKMVSSLGNEVVSGMIENSIKIMLQQDKERLGDARKAATSAFSTGEKIGGPAGPILGPVFAAAAFAGVMAFQDGGVVPGMGFGDVVPAMLTPGEGVVPKGVMEGLSNLAKGGGMGGGVHYNIASPHFSPTIHALDADGVDEILEKHADKFHKAFEGTLRKLNR